MGMRSKMSFAGSLIMWGLLCAALPFCTPLHAQDDQNAPPDAGSDVSFQTFYDSLANEGTWIQTTDYGYVWQPTISDPGWAPYTNGHWVYTEDGWTWVSDEPWGWATYHYGRWVNLNGTGWCWVPGYTWGPAWVSWRYGEGYCGWAPLPPDSLVGVDYASGDYDPGIGFHIGGDCDSYYGIGPGWYNFLPIVYLGDPNYRGYYVNRYDNYRLINRTTNVTNINVNRNASGSGFGAVTLGGPSLLQVNARSQSPVQRLNLAFTDRMGGGAVEGRSLSIFAPRVDAGTLRSSRPQTPMRSLGRAEVNRGTDVSRPVVVSSQFAAPGPTAQQIQLARSAQAGAPAEAKVARMNMIVPSSSATPLTAMRPVNFDYRPSTSVRSYQGYSGSRYSAPSSGGGDRYSAPSSGGGYIHSSPAPSYPSGSGVKGH
jgi:hypothetical protein